jgi:ATP-binding cassette, subfamily B, bacterial
LLFASTVWDNIGYGVPDATHEEIEQAARLANAHEFILALPNGYDTVLGERGATLSHGQRQRIAIARAAIRKAPILILDEPTTGLDERNEREVMNALERVAAGRTTLLISHNLQLVSRFDQIVYLEGGCVVERGSHDELMRADGRYAVMYKLQSNQLDHRDTSSVSVA